MIAIILTILNVLSFCLLLYSLKQYYTEKEKNFYLRREYRYLKAENKKLKEDLNSIEIIEMSYSKNYESKAVQQN